MSGYWSTRLDPAAVSNDEAKDDAELFCSPPPDRVAPVVVVAAVVGTVAVEIGNAYDVVPSIVTMGTGCRREEVGLVDRAIASKFKKW
jgi:hypothetical protein